MALIRLGPTVADARGSIGSNVFSRNRSGAYIRSRVKPTNPSTALQSAARNRVATCQSAYHTTLTDAQRNGWESAAASATFPNKLGEMTKITALNLFVMINTLRLEGGQAIIAACPPPPFKASVPALTITASAATGIIITAIAPALAVGDRLFWYLSSVKSNAVNYYRGPWESRDFVQSTDVAPITIEAAGAIAAGDRKFLMVRFQTADGYVSPIQRYVLDVTA